MLSQSSSLKEHRREGYQSKDPVSILTPSKVSALTLTHLVLNRNSGTKPAHERFKKSIPKQKEFKIRSQSKKIKTVMKKIRKTAAVLGTEVLYAGVKHIILPGEMKEIMNQVLVAQKKAQANVIMRREETASARSMLNTAKLLEENEMLYKLKEMEYLERIAAKIGEITVSGGSDVLKQLKQIF